MEKIEKRNIVPIAAMVNSGKSKLLNVLFNFNFLECKSGIATKFVNIIRYNPNIKQTRFFHLKVIKEGGDYTFYKDNNFKEIIGEQNIIDINKKINSQNSENNKIIYEDLFYMTEISECPFLKDKHYLLSHDLCDIPGLSEYQQNSNKKQIKENQIKDEKKENEDSLKEGKEMLELIDEDDNIINEKIDLIDTLDKQEDDIFYEISINETTYLTEIFKIIKNYIDGGIIVLSIENYYFLDNFQLITKLHKIIQKEIKNFIIILNKLDMSKDPVADIEKCKGSFIKYFPKCKTFNLNKNTFIPLSTYQLENELLMDKYFKNFINYHYFNYVTKIIRDKNKTSSSSFIDHLKEILTNINGITKDEIVKKVEELNNNANISKINNEIISIINNLKDFFSYADQIIIGISEENFKETTNSFIDEDFNDDINPSYIIKMMYILFNQKKMLSSYSYETNKLLEYFSIKNNVKIKKEEKIDKIEKNEMKINKRIINIYKNVLEILEDSKIIQIKNIMNEINKNIKFMEKKGHIFIPFLGPSNAGKTTIINGIIGKDILPTNLSESTKRGIIISYCNSEKITIRTVNIQSKNGEMYYNMPFGDIIGSGLAQVKQTLIDINYNFPDKKEDFFYLVQTRIKLFDELKLEENYKKMICLIDLPGYGTKNIFEKAIYNKLLSISNSFIFVVKNSLIKDKYTQEILEKIFIQAKAKKKKSYSEFLKSCLFIFNNEKTIETNNEIFNKTDDIINKGKDDIINMITGLKVDDKKNINLCFFNAKYYSNYCINFNYFSDLKNSFQNEYQKFIFYKCNIIKCPEKINNNKIYHTFCDFLYKELGNKINSIKFKTKFNNNQKIDKYVEIQTNELKLICGDMPNFGNFELIKDKINKILSFALENINEINDLKESNIESFKKAFSKQIKIVYNNMKEDIKDSINEITSMLDVFLFKGNISKENHDLEEIKSFKEIIDKIKENLNIIKNEAKVVINSFILKYKDTIFKKVVDKKYNCEVELKSKNYPEILEDINNEIKSHLKGLNDEIIYFLNNEDKKPLDLYNDANLKIKEFSFETIFLLTLPRFKEYFLKTFGNIDENLEEEILNEIKTSSQNLSNILYKKGFLEWFFSVFSTNQYLTNITSMIIDSFIFRIDFIREKLSEEFEKYINKMLDLINTRADLSTIIYEKEQKERLEVLKITYESIRTNLISIKFE